jgi:hypothetical protein
VDAQVRHSCPSRFKVLLRMAEQWTSEAVGGAEYEARYTLVMNMMKR